MRTDANNLVTTAHTTHLPEQQETIHMIQMMRKEAVSGNIQDLGHVRTADMLADCLTKHSAKPDVLIRMVDTGLLPNVDASPTFRSLLKHKAFVVLYLSQVLDGKRHQLHEITHFMNEGIAEHVQSYLATSGVYESLLSDGPVGKSPTSLAHPSRARWHTHVCKSCERHYTHFHDHPEFAASSEQNHTHENDHVCCYADCSTWYGANVDTKHNPLHSRPEGVSSRLDC